MTSVIIKNVIIIFTNYMAVRCITTPTWLFVVIVSWEGESSCSWHTTRCIDCCAGVQRQFSFPDLM